VECRPHSRGTWRLTRFSACALVLAAILAGCGNDNEQETVGASATTTASATETPTATPAPDTPPESLDEVAALAAEAVPDCTRYDIRRAPSRDRSLGMTEYASTACEGKKLRGLLMFEFKTKKAAEKAGSSLAYIDDPEWDDGTPVASGNAICQEESKGQSQANNCMLSVGRFVFATRGAKGSEADDALNETLPALARIVEVRSGA
jgi:hypothetical protein